MQSRIEAAKPHLLLDKDNINICMFPTVGVFLEYVFLFLPIKQLFSNPAFPSEAMHCTAQVRTSWCKYVCGHSRSQIPRLCWFHVSLWISVIPEAEYECSIADTTLFSLFVILSHWVCDNSFSGVHYFWLGCYFYLLKIFIIKKIFTLKVQIFVVAYNSIIIQRKKIWQHHRIT